MRRPKPGSAIDIETCPECGGKLRAIACIEDPPVIRKILGHVQRREAGAGRAARAPRIHSRCCSSRKTDGRQRQGGLRPQASSTCKLGETIQNLLRS